MNLINSDLKKYIENEILPIYEKNDSGHGIDHINYVVKRCIELSSNFSNINLDMMYTVATFHDIAHHIDKDNHEIISAQIFYENKKMKDFFNDEQRKIIKEAIEDHRASLKCEPRSDYGKIISSADKSIDIITSLKRTHAYTLKHYPHFNINEMIDRAYEHITKKFGDNGYANIWCVDEKYNQFKKEIKELLEDKEKFSKKYMEVNKITNIK